MADSDLLADHPEVRGRHPLEGWIDPLECEDILCVAYHAYQGLTGQELTVEVAGLQPRRGRRPAATPALPGLSEGWDFEDAAEMRPRYPRLWAVCGWEEASQRRLDANDGEMS